MTAPNFKLADTNDQYFTLAQLVAYSGLSLRTLERHLHTDAHPLPHYKIGGRYLVKRSEFDRWVERIGTPANVGRAKTRDAKVLSAVDGILGRK